MKPIMQLLQRLAREEDGAAAAEYAILVAFIAGAVAVAVQLFNLGAIFSTVSANVQGWIGQAPAAP